MDFRDVVLIVLDVDGVLTDGRLYVTSAIDAPSGVSEAKAFHVQDGCAVQVWRRCGHKVALLSGRLSSCTEARAKELGIEWVHMGVSDKAAGLKELLRTAECAPSAVAYLGDDLPDLAAMAFVGYPVAVANAVPAVKRAACHVTRRHGGFGAVAELVERILRKQCRWTQVKQGMSIRDQVQFSE